MKFWRLALGVTAALVAAHSARAQDIGFANVGMISATMGVNDGRICTGEFSRGDIGCASNAPYVSRTTGRLGIATTTPSATLHVNGNVIVRDYISLVRPEDGSFSPVLRGSSVTLVITGMNSGANPPAPSISLRSTGGMPLASVFAGLGDTGLLGINLSNAQPSATLHVSGTIRMADGGEACGANRAGAIKWNGSQFQVCYGSGGWATLSSAATSGTAVSGDRITSGTTSIVANDNGFVSLTTGGVNTGYLDTAGRLVVPGISATTNQVSFTTVYASGRVGITASSTVDSQGMLNINVGTWGTGQAVTATYIYGDADQRVLSVVRNTRSGNPGANAPFAGFAAEAYDSSDGRFNRAIVGLAKRSDNGVTPNGGNMVHSSPRGMSFYVNNKGIDWNTYGSFGTFSMTISDSGFVGIGTSEPSATLHVLGNTRTNQMTIAGGGGLVGSSGLYIDSGQDIRLAPSGTVSFIADRYGKTGIGTQAPATALHVSGTIRMADGGETCDTNRAGAIKWNGTQFQVCYGSGGWATLSSAATSGTAVSGDRITSGTTSIVASNDGSLTFTTGGTTNMVIGPGGTGHVGIGTVNPSVRLEVIGTVSATALSADGNSISVKRYSDGDVFLSMQATSQRTHYLKRLGGKLIFDTELGANGYNVMFNANNGNVGIGLVSSTTPSATLDVSGTARFKTAAADNSCTVDQDGAIRYNSTTGRLQICRPE